MQRNTSRINANNWIEDNTSGGVDELVTWIKEPTSQRPDHQMSAIPIPGVMWTIDLWCRRNGEPMGSEGRPPGLSRATRPGLTIFGPRTQGTDTMRQSEASIRKAVLEWRHPQAGRLKGGRPAPLCSVSSCPFAWSLWQESLSVHLLIPQETTSGAQ